MSHSIPFREYEFVKRHAEEIDLLEKLWQVRLDRDEVWSITDHVLRRAGWSPLKIDFTGRRLDRGFYYDGAFQRPRIQIAKSGTLAEVLAHELAHHGVGHLIGGRPMTANGNYRWHGIDFVNVLDRTAGDVADYIEINMERRIS